MIELIRVRNFKSLGEITLPLSKFSCLIGMNGAGKSSVLQVIDFISQLMLGEIKAWLNARGWTASDLNCKLRTESNVVLGVEFRLPSGELLVWEARFNRRNLRCSGETITVDGQQVFRSSGIDFRIGDEPRKRIAFTYEGSLLSRLKDSEIPEQVRLFRDSLRSIRSLELLSMHLLRKRARTEEKDIGVGGEKLSAFLDTIKGADRDKLVSMLKSFYPR